MLIIGLTGQSGAGKTTASQLFSQAGFFVINCDEIAHEILKISPCKEIVTEAFGQAILDENGDISRKKLGAIVFSDKERLQKLNEITHPQIKKEIMRKIDVFKNESYIVLDAPTLFESGADSFCDIIVSVICDREKSLKRIEERDGLDRKAAERRLENQKSEDFFRKNSDIIIENDLDMTGFLKSVSLAVAKIKSVK